MLYCIRIDVRVPHALAPEQLERLKAEQKARAGAGARRQVAAPVACCAYMANEFIADAAGRLQGLQDQRPMASVSGEAAEMA
jgi:muconolactone delta-isomerase